MGKWAAKKANEQAARERQQQDEAERESNLDSSKERYTGKWNGKTVSFKRSFSTHRFTDEECEQLLNGEEIVIDDLVSKSGKPYKIHGKLTNQSYEGHDFVGFMNMGFVNENTKDVNKDDVHEGPEESEFDDDDKDTRDWAPLSVRQSSDVSEQNHFRRDGLATQCMDMGVDPSELEPDEFRFTGKQSGIGSKVKRVAGGVAKGAGIAAGVGVLGLMAGTTALAAKGNSIKNELTVSFGESMSYLLARMLGGNDHMAVQRFQQAGMKGVEMVTGEKTLRKVARPLPTINMPVYSDNDLTY